MPRHRRAKPRRLSVRDRAAAIAESLAALDSDLPARLPIIRGSVTGAAESGRSPAKVRRTAMNRNRVTSDGTVRIVTVDADGTRHAAVYPPAIHETRRRATIDERDPIHPRAGRIGQHPVTGAPVAQHGTPTTTGMGDYPRADPADVPNVALQDAAIERHERAATIRDAAAREARARADAIPDKYREQV